MAAFGPVQMVSKELLRNGGAAFSASKVLSNLDLPDIQADHAVVLPMVVRLPGRESLTNASVSRGVGGAPVASRQTRRPTV